jgi:subtilisin family serine protease
VKVKKGSTRTIACNIPRPPQPGIQPRMATFNGWYDGADKLEVAVVPPAGPQTPYQAVITSGNPSKTYQTPYGAVRVITPGPDPANGDHNFFIQIQPLMNIPPTSKPHVWRIRVRGQKVSASAGSTLDLWVVDETVAEFTGIAVEDNMKVGAPGASATAVTVASYTTRNEWEDIFGNAHAAGMDVDDISDFSSEGPLRNGAKKPDVAAPGAMIVSALSVHAPTPQQMIVDDMNRVNAGTSMACPFVAGVAALLLERDPGLEPNQFKELLKKASSVPRKRAGTFDNKWGYGLIDVSEL